MKNYAFDLESYHSDELSISQQGSVNYLAQTDIFLMAVVGDNGFTWQGRPEEFDWKRLKGARLLAHNFAFDGAIFKLHPEWRQFKDWNCTANLCAFLGYPRALDKAVNIIFEEPLSKDPRKKMKGKRLEDLTPLQLEEFKAYNLHDAQLCLDLWQFGEDKWPKIERTLSQHTMEMGWGGINLDLPRLERYLEEAARIKEEAKAKIPWGEPLLSLPRARDYCVSIKIPAPESFAEDSLECGAWETEYGAQHDFVAALRDYRKANILLRKLEAMRARILPDGRLAYDLKYFGAHTGRWSGSSGLNMQNLGRTPWRGIFLRDLLIPSPEKKFIVADLSAIEPRVLAWLAGDTVLLNALREGWGVYEAAAISWGFWRGKQDTFKDTNPELYVKTKSLVLGCGYGIGYRKFRQFSLTYGISLTEAEAAHAVAFYRNKNPKVVQLWKKLEQILMLQHRGGEGALQIPSGRVLRYRELRYEKGGLWATVQKTDGYRPTKIWGGVLTENCVSALARDIFAEGILRLEKAGAHLVGHVHDEVIVEVPLNFAKEAVERLLSIPPKWAPDLPLAAKAQNADRYHK